MFLLIANGRTLWDKSLSPSSEDVAFVTLNLDTSLLREGGPVMHLNDNTIWRKLHIW